MYGGGNTYSKITSGRTLKVATSEDLKEKAEAKFEAELKAKLRLENNRKERAFRGAMIASPLGLYETASVAEHERGAEITFDSLRR